MSNKRKDLTNEEDIQNRIDSQEQTAEMQATSAEGGIMGVKAQLKVQILGDIKRVPRGKLMLHWIFQLAPNTPFIRTLYPFLLALGYETDIETVCDVFAELLEAGDIMAIGNVGGSLTGEVLTDRCQAFLRAYNDKGGPESRKMKGVQLSLVSPIMASGKALTQEDAKRILAF